MSAHEPITAVQAADPSFRLGVLSGVVSELAALGEHVARLPHDEVVQAVQRLTATVAQLDGEVRTVGGAGLVDDTTAGIWSTHWHQVAERDGRGAR